MVLSEFPFYFIGSLVNKNVILFQLLLCACLFKSSHAMDSVLHPITIERCPSVTRSFEFCEEVEQRVAEAEKKSAEAAVLIKFDDALVPLLRKLDSQELLKAVWQTRLSALFKKLASGQHRVSGLYCAYQYIEDLKFVASMIKPLADSKKLKQCRLTQIPAIGINAVHG